MFQCNFLFLQLKREQTMYCTLIFLIIFPDVMISRSLPDRAINASSFFFLVVRWKTKGTKIILVMKKVLIVLSYRPWNQISQCLILMVNRKLLYFIEYLWTRSMIEGCVIAICLQWHQKYLLSEGVGWRVLWRRGYHSYHIKNID